MAMKEIEISLENLLTFILIAFLFIVFILNFQVVLSTRINFGDEGYHSRLAQYFAETLDFPIYIPFGRTPLIATSNSKPMFWNWLEASFLFLTFNSELVLKFLTPFVALLVGIVTYLLGKRVFSKEIAFLTSVLIVTSPSFVIYSVTLYTDAFFTLCMSVFFFSFLVGVKENNKKFLYLSMVFGAFAFLTKVPGVSCFVFFFLFLAYKILKEKKVVEVLKN